MPYDMNRINFQVFFLSTFVLLGAFLCLTWRILLFEKFPGGLIVIASHGS